MKTPKLCRYFSVVEVIVVSAVIAILASLVMSASSSIREAGKRTTCLNNLKQIQAIYEAYRKDHRKSPEGDSQNHDDFSFAKNYVEVSDLDTFICPGDSSAEKMTSIDHLDGHTSYTYIPAVTSQKVFTTPVAELASNENVDLASLNLVVLDNNVDNHGGDRNIVYLHGSGNSKAGIAQTLKAGAYEWSIQEDDSNDNASDSNESSDDEAANEDEATEEATEVDKNAQNENSELEEAQEVLADLEEDLVEASDDLDEAREVVEEAEAAEEVAEEAAKEAAEEAVKNQAEKDEAQKDLDEQLEALEEAKNILENGPKEYDSSNIDVPEDNKGNQISVNTDVQVTFELIGSGFSSNSIYSDVTVGSETYKWQDDDGEEHSNHVVGVEGLTLDVDVETGLTIAINGRSSYYDSANLQGKSNLMVYRDGDKATNVGGYNGQDSVKTFLADYIDSDGNVTIGDNQVIFLMELGTTNTSKSYYDMQDLVVLATFDIVATESDVNSLEDEVQKAKEALILATTNANQADVIAEQATTAAAAAAAAAEAAQNELQESQNKLNEVENAVLEAEEAERELS
jgi:type II secretory pathway pseudopilin PulG